MNSRTEMGSIKSAYLRPLLNTDHKNRNAARVSFPSPKIIKTNNDEYNCRIIINDYARLKNHAVF